MEKGTTKSNAKSTAAGYQWRRRLVGRGDYDPDVPSTSTRYQCPAKNCTHHVYQVQSGFHIALCQGIQQHVKARAVLLKNLWLHNVK